MKQVHGGKARYGAVDSLRLRLIATVGGVTVSVACAGRSIDHRGAGGGSDGGNGGSSAVGGKGGAGATGGAAGKNPTGGTGGDSVGGTSGIGGTGGVVGGASGDIGGATGTVGGAGGVSGVGGVDGGVGGLLAGMGGTAIGGTAGAEPLGCVGFGDFASGLEFCVGGYVHRASPVTCELSPRTGFENGGQAGEAGVAVPEPSPCVDDFDCTAAPNGYCVRNPPSRSPFGPTGPFCAYSCVTDADCDTGYACACLPDTYFESNYASRPVRISQCVPASCNTDAECEGDALCVAPVSDVCGPRIPASFHCQSPNDECSGMDNCPATSESNRSMCVEMGDHYGCQSAMCGRPFLVEGMLRQSELVLSEAWLAGDLASNGPTELDDEARPVVAEHWAKAGLMEHASIAAFARFSLQLLALGAPPDLVQRATEAMADETRHAELCFGLASRYAGHALGPSPLDVSEALGAVDLFGVVELVVEEGCIGETAAALEAAWAAEAATDTSVRRVLLGIADDEARHAELAFAFVAWAARQDARVLGHVEAKLSSAKTACGATTDFAPSASAREAQLAAQGVLPESIRREARRATLLEILPALVAHLSCPARARPHAVGVA